MASERVKWLRVASRASGTYPDPAQLKSRQLESAIKQCFHRLVLLDPLSVAVLIHTVEEDCALVLMAVELDKLCTQQNEVHKAKIEVCKANVEPHKAYVEVHKAHVEVHRAPGTHRNPRELSQGKVQRLSKHQYIRLVLLDMLSVAVLIHIVEALHRCYVYRTGCAMYTGHVPCIYTGHVLCTQDRCYVHRTGVKRLGQT